MLRADASRGFRLGDSRSLFAAGGLTGRIEDGSARDALISGALRYYWHTSPRSTFFASLAGDVGQDLDADHELVLGGEEGLRGYPLRYQTGSSRALLTVEQRYYSKYSLWKLAQIGGAVFFDMGRTWGGSALLPTFNLGILKDIGFGLRLGSTRSGLANVLHLDVAFPLDGDSSIDNVQFLVGTKNSF
jgi:hemolysin activation/secretion protein